MERFLCLDIGDKRIGVAVSDPFNSYALPVCTVVRKNLKTDLEKVGALIKEKGATAVVCGLPVNFDGTESLQTQKAKFFIDKVHTEFNIKVLPVDERCSTIEAEEFLIEEGYSRKERKTCIDALAAQTILEGFLGDYNRKNLDGKSVKENNMSDKEKKNLGKDCGCDHDCDCEHDHDHDCDCGHDHCDCGCEEDIITLTMDNGDTHKFYADGTIEYKGKYYSAFEPAEEIEGLSEGDVVIFELTGDDEETAELVPVEDEKLLDEVFEEFCRVLDEEETEEEEENK